MTPLDYAARCARADASRNNAILCLRNLIETDNWPVTTALNAIMAAFPLGLIEIAEISAEAQRRYANG